jgi:hypothetical protein
MAPSCPDPRIGEGVYTAPDGTPEGDGSEAAPWDLATALSQPLMPGTTLWLRGGTYTGTFHSSLTGDENSLIVVRGYPGEHAVIDGGSDPHANTLTIEGAWALYRDFEVTNSDPLRIITDTGSNPPDARGAGITVNGPNTKLVNLVVHDCGVGIGTWSPASDAEVYGTIVYYNGWDAPDRGHGHAIYAQNQNGAKKLTDNILFRQFSYGIHAYTEGGNIDNIDARGNISFDNGVLASTGPTTDILIGGQQIAQKPILESNYTYYPLGEGTGSNIGYSAGCTDLVAEDNYLVGATALTAVACTVQALSGNTFVGDTNGVTAAMYPDNTFSPGRPTGMRVFVRPNAYEPGRAHVVVYDWDGAGTASVDLDGVLAVGDDYEILDVQDLSGAPVLAGTYDGTPVDVPLDGTSVAPTVGDVTNAPQHTAPEFNAFLLRPVCR